MFEQHDREWQRILALASLGVALGIAVLAILAGVQPFTQWVVRLDSQLRLGLCIGIVLITSVLTTLIARASRLFFLELAAGLFLVGSILALRYSTALEYWKELTEYLDMSAVQMGLALASLSFAMFAILGSVGASDIAPRPTPPVPTNLGLEMERLANLCSLQELKQHQAKVNKLVEKRERRDREAGAK